ncbi:DUF5994 family protein [Actinacidiphila sp. DG2A-62]|uniref:DUF5994 family protein n=1 Tax=Actinacidiphila sp. DG2A-62 TaxID=3108821 RepID=UPI002DBA9623|nr:DUF5994 family protein [Actinacidiphila sp. DG2A-62]MEC3995363.1 DUF5994 family protein [Actinacidiphila sp. DG2A-62]
MTATPLHTPTTEEAFQARPPARPPLRLSLVPVGSASVRLDGAWWPRSRDLAAELPTLTDELDLTWDRITRITVNPTHWPVVPHKVQGNGHVVKVGWFKEEQDPHQLMLMSYRVGRWDLLVIPPETPPTSAAWLLAAAADPSRTSTGSQLMAEAGRRAAEEIRDMPEAVWDSEGGRAASLATAEEAAT